MANEKPKQLLFSLTREDFEWDYFRSGGKGGQNQNKVNSGVRCTHRPSGSVGEARDSRNQLQNRRSAFLRCVQTNSFKIWHRNESLRRIGSTTRIEIETKGIQDSIWKEVERQMAPENLKVETYDPNKSS